jgi:hypothetical protein
LFVVSGRHSVFQIQLAVLIFAGVALTNASDPEPAWNPETVRIVIGIRYLQIKGTSHSQLYLMRGDGHVMRQLTSVDKGDDHDPALSPTSNQIVFQRKIGKTEEFWSVNLNGEHLRRLVKAQDWYADSGTDLTYFDVRAAVPGPYNPSAFDPIPGGPNGPLTYTSSDGSFELSLIDPDKRTDEDKWESRGRTFLVRDFERGDEYQLGSLPGFEGLWDAMHLRTRKQSNDNAPFFLYPPLRVVFFWSHLNSTDGDTVSAVDLAKRPIVHLSPNWATPIPIPNHAGFLTVSEERYLPLDDGRIVNCSYLDYWNADLERVRFGRDAPARFYGATILYSNGKRTTIRFQIPETN